MKLCLLSLSIIILPALTEAKSIKHGKYLVRTMGCNDCHTAQYSMKGGNVPEDQWLVGSPVGFKGAWGTTYPANLRKLAHAMSEKEWVDYLSSFKARPPMPSYDTNLLSKEDSRAIYAFLKSLGPSSFEVPDYLPPGVEPKTPYFDFDLKNIK